MTPLYLRARGRALYAVLRDAKPVWLCLAGLAVSVVIGLLLARFFAAPAQTTPQIVNDSIRDSGTLLQLLGLVLVVKGLSDARRIFGRPSIASATRSWFARLRDAVRTPRSITLQVEPAVVTVSAPPATLSVTPREGASLEERVSTLEGTVKRLERELRDELSTLQSTVNALRKGTARDVASLRTADEDLKRKTEEFAVGGLHLEAAGVVWLLLGTIATNMPEECGRFVCWILRC